MNIEEFIKINKSQEEINQLSPLVWAYVGDAIYELYIRTYLVDTTKLNPHKLHIEAINYVKASAQANFLNKFYEQLTDEEKDISRLEITIHEGKNRQVRRMCESVGRRVIALHRSKIGNIGVKDIELGKWRYLKDFEVKTLIGK